MFENRPKSRIQYYERSELRFTFTGFAFKKNSTSSFRYEKLHERFHLRRWEFPGNHPKVHVPLHTLVLKCKHNYNQTQPNPTQPNPKPNQTQPNPDQNLILAFKKNSTSSFRYEKLHERFHLRGGNFRETILRYMYLHIRWY